MAMNIRHALPRAILYVLLAAPAAVTAQPQSLDQSCTAIGELSLPETRITGAEAIHVDVAHTITGTEKGMGLTAPVQVHRSLCRISGVVAPAIHFEIWMPLENWNGRFEGLGLGAFWGALPYEGMARALDEGYAVGGTDTGHQSDWDDGSWAMADGKLNRGLVEDWAHRGIHEMTVKSQSIVAKFYARRPDHSYFAGCSSGGYQALTEAQRYPTDYDGILAGAPANYLTHLQAAQLSMGLDTHVKPATSLEMPVDKLPLLHRAVLEACDAADGVKDGLIENPAACHFDPAVLVCKAGASEESCLTPPQVQAVRRVYADIRRGDGSKLFPGFPYGSELNWKLMTDKYLGKNGQLAFAQTFYRYFVFQDRTWSYTTMNLERDIGYADTHVGNLVNSIDPDLRPFRDHGGKLLQYHGWADWGITPYSIDYFHSVVSSVGGSASEKARTQVQKFDRLFLLPGVSHCRGGDGPDTFDGLGALQAWVERGEAPMHIEAAKLVDGKPVRTRLLCPYPQVSRYKGSGSIDAAANFECASTK